VVHWKKNKNENVMKIIFGAKDIITVCENFKECGIWPHLWLQNVVGKVIKTVISFVLIYEEKERFTQI
jgi:hypothetical protein